MKPGHSIGNGQRFTDEDEQACQLAREGRQVEGWIAGVVTWLFVFAIAIGSGLLIGRGIVWAISKFVR